jgi:hypothetical protein
VGKRNSKRLKAWAGVGEMRKKSKKKNKTPSIPLDEGGQKIFLVNFKKFFNGKSFSRE